MSPHPPWAGTRQIGGKDHVRGHLGKKAIFPSWGLRARGCVRLWLEPLDLNMKGQANP